jgi:hypothetical protein
MSGPLSATVSIECKTPACPGIFVGDFVFDSVEWKERFTEKELTCDICLETHTYSREDVVLTPSTITPE